MTTYYRVLKSASGIREYLTPPVSKAEATAHLESVVCNLVTNGYIKSTQESGRLLPVVILGWNSNIVTLSVVECNIDTALETKRELKDMSWLVRVPEIDDNDTRELHLNQETPTDGLFDPDGADDYASEQESAGV